MREGIKVFSELQGLHGELPPSSNYSFSVLPYLICIGGGFVCFGHDRGHMRPYMSSLTRGQSWDPCAGNAESLNHWVAREVLTG